MEKEKMNAQENVHRIITEWKKRRTEDEKEAAEKISFAAFKKTIEQLKKKNEERGIHIPGI